MNFENCNSKDDIRNVKVGYFHPQITSFLRKAGEKYLDQHVELDLSFHGKKFLSNKSIPRNAI